jgi:hypothetical protein
MRVDLLHPIKDKRATDEMSDHAEALNTPKQATEERLPQACA